MKIGQNLTRNPMVTSDLAYHVWFKSCASFNNNVPKICLRNTWTIIESKKAGLLKYHLSCVKHGHVVPSKYCWSTHRADQLCLLQHPNRTGNSWLKCKSQFKLDWAGTELELSLAIWLEKCKCLLTSLLCLTVYLQPNNTVFDTVGNKLEW